MGGLKESEYLSLVTKVCSELELHAGCSDKTLAEFIIDLAQQSEVVDSFSMALKSSGTEMPDYFVHTLLKIIHAVLPPKGTDEGEAAGDDGKSSLPNPLHRLKDEGQESAMNSAGGRDWDRRRDLSALPRGRCGDDYGMQWRDTSVDGERDSGMDNYSVRRRDRAMDEQQRIKGIPMSVDRYEILMDRDRDDDRRIKGKPKGWDTNENRKNAKNCTCGDGENVRIKEEREWHSDREEHGPSSSGITIVEEDGNNLSHKPLRRRDWWESKQERLSAPESWEAEQLSASAVVDVRDCPIYDEGGGFLHANESAEEEFEIELNQLNDNACLIGQTRYPIDVAPVKIVKCRVNISNLVRTREMTEEDLLLTLTLCSIKESRPQERLTSDAGHPKVKGKRSSRIKRRNFDLKQFIFEQYVDEVEEISFAKLCSSRGPFRPTCHLPSNDKILRSARLRRRRSGLPCKGSCVAAATCATGKSTNSKGNGGLSLPAQAVSTKLKIFASSIRPVHDGYLSLRRALSNGSVRKNSVRKKIPARWKQLFSVC